MEITINLSLLRRLLTILLALLIHAGLWVEFWDDVLKLSDPYDLVAFFSLSYERNLPTWFVSSLLYTCGLVLCAIALTQQPQPYRCHWWVLAGTFFYISLDEFVSLHERMNGWTDLGGIFYFNWIIPACFMLIVWGSFFLGFLAHLPANVRKQFVLSGSIYVGGALGMELPLGYWTDIAGDNNFTYGVIDLIEESMELIGVSLFLYALVSCLGIQTGVLRIRLMEPLAGGSGVSHDITH